MVQRNFVYKPKFGFNLKAFTKLSLNFRKIAAKFFSEISKLIFGELHVNKNLLIFFKRIFENFNCIIFFTLSRYCLVNTF